MGTVRKLITTSNYEKDLRKISKNPNFDKDNLTALLTLLQNGEELPAKAKDHQMAKHSPKEYKDCRDFHPAPNIVVIYKREETAIYLYRIGSHSYLNLTETVITG